MIDGCSYGVFYRSVNRNTEIGGHMRKAVLYIAMSLDGFIAELSGGVDWLKGDGSEPRYFRKLPSFL